MPLHMSMSLHTSAIAVLLPTSWTCSGLIEHFQRTTYSVAPGTAPQEIGQGSQHSQD